MGELSESGGSDSGSRKYLQFIGTGITLGLVSFVGYKLWNVVRKTQRAVDSLVRKSTLTESDSDNIKSAAVPVYVMCDLDVTAVPISKLRRQFRALKRAGVTGVMMDFWWSKVETEPGVYNWSIYEPVLQLAQQFELKVQAVMSFHVCGECDGDGVFVPLPEFVTNLARDQPDILFNDEFGSTSAECLSFGVDHERIFPSASGSTASRTAIEMYQEFMTSFKLHFSALMPHVIEEIQVGLGPSGELRYPSYSLSKWTFPGIGALQCYDIYLEDELRSVTGSPPPRNVVRSYNDFPDNTLFFAQDNGTIFTAEGKKFFMAYFERMYRHGEDMLSMASKVFSGSGVKLSGKISGIHWFRKHPSRASEAIAGYYCSEEFNSYGKLAELFKKYNTVFLFTCMEKKDSGEGEEAMASPELLVKETSEFVAATQCDYGGENALEFKDADSYQMILDQVDACQSRGAAFKSFTLLRLDDNLISWSHYPIFNRFVQEMSK